MHEYRELLDQVKRWEESELKDAQVDRPPAYLTKGPGPLAKKSLAPINYSNPSVGAAAPGNNNSNAHPGLELLNSKISDLTDENQQLREKLKQLEKTAASAPAAAKEIPSPSPLPPPAPLVTADQAEKSNQEIEELTQAFKQVKTKLADELESNCQEKKELETNLVSTTHQLLEVKHNLSLAEKVKLVFKFD